MTVYRTVPCAGLRTVVLKFNYSLDDWGPARNAAITYNSDMFIEDITAPGHRIGRVDPLMSMLKRALKEHLQQTLNDFVTEGQQAFLKDAKLQGEWPHRWREREWTFEDVNLSSPAASSAPSSGTSDGWLSSIGSVGSSVTASVAGTFRSASQSIASFTGFGSSKR